MPIARIEATHTPRTGRGGADTMNLADELRWLEDESLGNLYAVAQEFCVGVEEHAAVDRDAERMRAIFAELRERLGIPPPTGAEP